MTWLISQLAINQSSTPIRKPYFLVKVDFSLQLFL